MMTTEQIESAIQNLPDRERQRLLARMSVLSSGTVGDEKWNRARREISRLSGALNLGEQLVSDLDRETVYEDRF